MASGPITSWEIDGETVETVSDFIFMGSKITTDGDCSYEIKRRLLLGRKVMTNLICLLRNLYAGQEATVRTGHGTTDWFQIRKGVHLAYLTYMQSTSGEMPGWIKHKLESRFPGEIPMTSDMQMTSP